MKHYSTYQSQFIEMFKDLPINGKIKDLVERNIASVKKSYQSGDEIEYIDISSIDNTSNTVVETTKYEVASAPSRAQQCVKNGDILVSTVRPINRNIAVVTSNLPDLVASTGFCILRPKDGYREYLLSVVKSDAYTERMCDKASGGLYPAVNNRDVLSYGIHIPNKELAQKVSSIYQQADKSKFTSLKSQFIEMFGQVSEESPCLNDIARVYDGTHKTPTYTDSGIPFISVENITDIYSFQKYISREDYELYKHKPEHGDIFMTRIGSIGKCAVYESFDPLAYYVSLALIKPNKDMVHPKFLKYYIESLDGAFELRKRSLLKAFPMKINLGEIGKIKVIVPAKDKQLEFVKIAEQADKSKYIN